MKIIGLRGEEIILGGMTAAKGFFREDGEETIFVYTNKAFSSAYLPTPHALKSEAVQFSQANKKSLRRGIVISRFATDTMQSGAKQVVACRLSSVEKTFSIKADELYAVSLGELFENRREKTSEYSFAYRFFLGDDYPCVIGGSFFTHLIGAQRKKILLLTTDVRIEDELLKKTLEAERKDTVDLLGGGCGVNDCICMLASGEANNATICVRDTEWSKFSKALGFVLSSLCKMAVVGESTEKAVFFKIVGATSRKVTRAISLKLSERFSLKGEEAFLSAVFSAIGDISVPITRERANMIMSSDQGKMQIVESGRVLPYSSELFDKILNGGNAVFTIDLGEGNYSGGVWIRR